MKFPTLRGAAGGLNIEPQNASNWLAAMGITTDKSIFQLSRATCITLALCARLSRAGVLAFGDPGIVALLSLVRDGNCEDDLRTSLVVIRSDPTRRRVALTGDDKIVLKHMNNGGGVEWVGNQLTFHWQIEAPTLFIALEPVYAQVDAFFEKLNTAGVDPVMSTK